MTASIVTTAVIALVLIAAIAWGIYVDRRDSLSLCERIPTPDGEPWDIPDQWKRVA